MGVQTVENGVRVGAAPAGRSRPRRAAGGAAQRAAADLPQPGRRAVVPLLRQHHDPQRRAATAARTAAPPADARRQAASVSPPRQRAHGIRRRALHSLSLALARHPGLVAYTQTLTRARRERLARIALIFEFVHRLAAAEAVRRARAQELREAGLREGDLPAALLCGDAARGGRARQRRVHARDGVRARRGGRRGRAARCRRGRACCARRRAGWRSAWRPTGGGRPPVTCRPRCAARCRAAARPPLSPPRSRPDPPLDAPPPIVPRCSPVILAALAARFHRRRRHRRRRRRCGTPGPRGGSSTRPRGASGIPIWSRASRPWPRSIPAASALEEIGRSAEGRAIHLLAVGSGERRVLLWSQMHGDEPSATPALLDVADHLLARRREAGAVLDDLTLLMVPMLNPDGTERGARRNAQGIDVNRDALNLATPEGRILKAVRDRYQPILGFNLHDQDRRTTVGETGRLATIALLAVAGDPAGHDDRGPAARQARLRGDRRRPRAARSARPSRATTRTGARARSATTSPPGARRWCWWRAGAAAGPAAHRPHAAQLRGPRLRAVGAGRGRPRRPRPRRLRAADPQPRATPSPTSWCAAGASCRARRRAVPRRHRLRRGRAGRRALGMPGRGRRRPSRIVEVGDARFLAAGRDVDAAGRAHRPRAHRVGPRPRRAPVAHRAGARRHGAARRRRGCGGTWRDARRRARRWPSSPSARGAGAAGDRGRRRAADAPSPLVAVAPAAAARRRARWPTSSTRSATVATLAASLSGRRSGLAPPTRRPRSLTRDAPASFLVLRPDPPSAPRPLELDAVYIDGRELAPRSDRPSRDDAAGGTRCASSSPWPCTRSPARSTPPSASCSTRASTSSASCPRRCAWWTSPRWRRPWPRGARRASRSGSRCAPGQRRRGRPASLGAAVPPAPAAPGDHRCSPWSRWPSIPSTRTASRCPSRCRRTGGSRRTSRRRRRSWPAALPWRWRVPAPGAISVGVHRLCRLRAALAAVGVPVGRRIPATSRRPCAWRWPSATG